MTDRPQVSVWMVTYNHEPFIRQAIDSVLGQKTSFPFRLYIGDDCSTDLTGQICQDYQQRFPGRVEVVINPSNIGPAGNARNIYEKCFKSGARYIALLEGDDYWIDNTKLQRQYDYLESHPEASLYLHNAYVMQGRENVGLKTGQKQFKRYTLRDALQRKVLGPTSSYFFRNVISLPFPDQIVSGDALLLILLQTHGELHYFPEPMSVYRLHPSSFERTFDTRPLEKALRDNQLYRKYVDEGLVKGNDAAFVIRKICWNSIYRIMKGISIGRFDAIPMDSRQLASYLMLLLSNWFRAFLSHWTIDF